MLHYRKGFTLIEILLVVAAIAILAGIVIFAINPAKQLGDARNAQRRSDVNSIINAIYQYAIDNSGTLPVSLTTDQVEICKSDAVCTDLIDMSNLTTNQKYLVTIPFDPNDSSENGTGYFIELTNSGRIRVLAPSAEQGATISVIR